MEGRRGAEEIEGEQKQSEAANERIEARMRAPLPLQCEIRSHRSAKNKHVSTPSESLEPHGYGLLLS